MPDEKLPPKPAGSVKIEKTLDGVLGWVQKKKSLAEDPKSKATKSSPWGWVIGLIVAVVVMVGLAIVAYWAWQKGREIAKLKHQIDVDKEKKIKAEVDAKIAEKEEEKKLLEAEALRLKVKIDRAKDTIRGLETDRKAAHAKIDAITRWEDVDAFLEQDDES